MMRRRKRKTILRKGEQSAKQMMIAAFTNIHFKRFIHHRRWNMFEDGGGRKIVTEMHVQMRACNDYNYSRCCLMYLFN